MSIFPLLRCALVVSAVFCLSLPAVAQSSADTALAIGFGTLRGPLAAMAQLKNQPQIPASSLSRPPATLADKANLRYELRLSYAMAYAIVDTLFLAEKTYSVACTKPESYGNLMELDMALSFALEKKKALAKHLALAAQAASSDSGANETALHLVQELNAMTQIITVVTASAKRCEDFMIAKDGAANNASGGSDTAWSASRTQAGILVKRMAQFGAAAELQAAQALVVLTQ